MERNIGIEERLLAPERSPHGSVFLHQYISYKERKEGAGIASDKGLRSTSNATLR